MEDIRRPGGSARRPLARVDGAVAAPDTLQTADKGDLRDTGSGGRSPKQRLIIVGGAVLILLFAATSVFFFWQYKNSRSGDDTVLSRQVIDNVSSLYFVPEGEEPTVAEIKDTSKLKDQPFFEKAQNGDYLLVYQQAKIAIIYRTSAHKLVNVAPVNSNPAEGNNIQQETTGDSAQDTKSKDTDPVDSADSSQER